MLIFSFKDRLKNQNTKIKIEKNDQDQHLDHVSDHHHLDHVIVIVDHVHRQVVMMVQENEIKNVVAMNYH